MVKLLNDKRLNDLSFDTDPKDDMETLHAHVAQYFVCWIVRYILLLNHLFQCV